jgi:hypothetical protein
MLPLSGSLRPGTWLLFLVVALLLSACDGNIVLFPTPPAPGPSTTPAVSGDGLPADATSPPSQAPACSAYKLGAIAGWQPVASAMAGAVSVTNTGEVTCTLEGRPGIHLLDAEGNLMPVANLNPPREGRRERLLLRPGERAFVRFVWSNWCGSADGPYSLAVALQGDGGQITIPGLDAEGNKLTIAPGCSDRGVSSTITVDKYQK